MQLVKSQGPQNNKRMTKVCIVSGLGSISRKIHPFPARMAPEIALSGLRFLPEGGTVLDPMCGSGTVLCEALHQGHRAIGFDVDPLAVLISRVSTRSVDTARLAEVGDTIAGHAVRLQRTILHIPWIDGDEDTLRFTKFWFASEQRRALRSLVWLVMRMRGPVGDALRLAISKIIVTKEPCASLARDTSHSRPHRVTSANDYDVIQGFRRAVTQIVGELNRAPATCPAVVRLGDARRLPLSLTGRADLVVTSPPYGNAIDYLRGHRMALVWLGYNIPRLREMRRRSIGGQGTVEKKRFQRVVELAGELGLISDLDLGTRRRLLRFTQDMWTILEQIHRSLRPNGHAVLAVGNSSLKGMFIDNANMIATAAEWVGLKEISRYSREIPANHRYLPPPQTKCDLHLSRRMSEEVVLAFKKVR